MSNIYKTKEKLASEGTELRQPVAELEASKGEHKQVAVEAVNEQEKLSAILEFVSDGVAITDPGLNITDINEAGLRMFGYSRKEEITGRSGLELISPKDRARAMVDMRSTLGKGHSGKLKYTFLDKEGREFLAEYSVIVIRDRFGSPAGFVATMRDVTERKQAEEKYQAIVKTALDSFGLHDLEGRFLEVNDSCCRMFGYTREELLKMSIPDIEVIENPEMIAQHIKKIMKQGYDRFESRHKRKDGKIINVEISANYLDVEGGRLFVFVRDITKHKQAEEALREAELRYRTVADFTYDWEFWESPDGTYRYVSPSCERITGYKVDEFISNPDLLPGIIVAKDIEKWLAHRRKAVKKRAVHEVQFRIQRKDGEVRWIEHVCHPVIDDQGIFLGYRASNRDVTKHKKAEEALRESEEFRSSLLANSPIPMIVINPDTSVKYVNPALEKITGLSSAEIIGRKAPYPWWTEETLQKTRGDLATAMRQGAVRLEELFQKKNGEQFWVEITSGPIMHDGEFRYYLANWVDITERKQAEEREKRLRGELYRSTRLASVGELAAGVAHEMNNPLTGILGFSQRLLRKSADDKTKESLELIHNEAQRATKVVKNLLTFARRREPKKEFSDINGILQTTLDLRAYELKTGNIEVILDLADNLPQIMVDFYQIQEVFLNIILNAEQAMIEAHGGGKLTIKTKKIEDYVRISFTDDGPGIPVVNLDRLFDPFFTTRGERGGTGLGLSLCHGIVAEHDGKICARSKAGKGATILVQLPLTRQLSLTTEKIDESKVAEEKLA